MDSPLRERVLAALLRFARAGEPVMKWQLLIDQREREPLIRLTLTGGGIEFAIEKTEGGWDSYQCQ